MPQNYPANISKSTPPDDLWKCHVLLNIEHSVNNNAVRAKTSNDLLASMETGQETFKKEFGRNMTVSTFAIGNFPRHDIFFNSVDSLHNQHSHVYFYHSFLQYGEMRDLFG